MRNLTPKDFVDAWMVPDRSTHNCSTYVVIRSLGIETWFRAAQWQQSQASAVIRGEGVIHYSVEEVRVRQSPETG